MKKPVEKHQQLYYKVNFLLLSVYYFLFNKIFSFQVLRIQFLLCQCPDASWDVIVADQEQVLAS